MTCLFMRRIPNFSSSARSTCAIIGLSDDGTKKIMSGDYHAMLKVGCCIASDLGIPFMIAKECDLEK